MESNFHFNIGHIVAYFVTRSVSDNKAATDLKSINKSAEGLYNCGHVQTIQVKHSIEDECVYIQAKCLPKMRKDKVYLLQMVLKSDEYDIIFAKCGCPAGKAPHGSCKHIAALSFALADFSRLKSLPELQTCTDVLQQWNQPRSRHVQILPVEELGSHRRKLQPSAERTQGSGVIFDPRPEKVRSNIHRKNEM